MFRQRRVNDSVHFYMNELGARVVAESGRACDRFHLGKLMLRSLKDDPNYILQIDGATGERETSGLVLKRSVRCAQVFSAMGLKCGDVIILMAPNHLDLCIPYYAALYLGVAVAPIDQSLNTDELRHVFLNDEPKIIFCQSDKESDVHIALRKCKMESKVITFDENSGKIEETVCFRDFMMKSAATTAIDDFKPSDFDPEKTIAVLVPTSGSTTGLLKQAVGTHQSCAIAGRYIWITESIFPHPTRMCMLPVPLKWNTAILQFNFSSIMRYTRLQSSKPIEVNHAFHLINTYKPSYMIISPTILSMLLNSSDGGKCDWTCFDYIVVGGVAVSEQLLNDLKELAPDVHAIDGYGISEIAGIGFMPDIDPIPKSIGKMLGHLQYRLIDTVTKKDIYESHQPGELYLKGPTVIKEYYKNPEASKEALTEDGWYKTGDLMYRDDHWNFYFVDRIKMMLKCKGQQVSPTDIERVIGSYPGVLDVAVTGVPDHEYAGDFPVACVVRRPGSIVTAKEIKDLVKDNFTDAHQLRGGVIFLSALPTTTIGKLDFKELKEIVRKAHKE